MESVFDVASYICNKYNGLSNEEIDKMKLLKILYYVQRQSLAVYNTPLFSNKFEAWKYGPVCREIWDNYEAIINNKDFKIETINSYLIDDVIATYGPFESWKLSQMTHEEESWIKARGNCDPNDYCDSIISDADIREDGIKALTESGESIDADTMAAVYEARYLADNPDKASFYDSPEELLGEILK
jgi:uncharacterized phage-associated protein